RRVTAGVDRRRIAGSPLRAVLASELRQLRGHVRVGIRGVVGGISLCVGRTCKVGADRGRIASADASEVCGRVLSHAGKSRKPVVVVAVVLARQALREAEDVGTVATGVQRTASGCTSVEALDAL